MWLLEINKQQINKYTLRGLSWLLSWQGLHLKITGNSCHCSPACQNRSSFLLSSFLTGCKSLSLCFSFWARKWKAFQPLSLSISGDYSVHCAQVLSRLPLIVLDSISSFWSLILSWGSACQCCSPGMDEVCSNQDPGDGKQTSLCDEQSLQYNLRHLGFVLEEKNRPENSLGN